MLCVLFLLHLRFSALKKWFYVLDTLQGLFPGALPFSTTQEGLTGAIDLNVKIFGPDV